MAAQPSPYPGLGGFAAADRRFFFGRADLVAEALDRLRERAGGLGPLVLVGASGAGKSSVLRAGILPAVERGALGAALPTGSAQVTLVPSEHPLVELATRVAAALGVPALGWLLHDAARAEPARFAQVLADLSAPQTSGYPTVASTAAAASTVGTASTVDTEGVVVGLGRPVRRLLIAVDQFEEAFTLCADEAEREAFVRALCAAATGPTAPVVVVLAVRGDFYLRCAAYPDLAEALAHGQIVVGPLEQPEVRAAIVEPARAAGVEVEPALVDLLLDDLSRPAGTATAPPSGARGLADAGALPLLAHVLRVTWDLRADRTLRVETYRAVGRLAGALARTADDLFTELDDAGRQAARTLLLHLVRIGEEGQHTRRPLRRASLLDEIDVPREQAAATLDRLIAARLLEADEDRVQIVHEALLWSWPRLRDWIERDRAGALIRQQLDDRAQEWERHGHDPSFLYTGMRLAAAREWVQAGGRRRALGERAGRFYDASLARESAVAAAARRRTRRLRALVAGLTVLVVLAASLTTAFLGQRSEAAGIRDRARSQFIAGMAQDQAISRPELSAHLALAARGFADTSEARSAILGVRAPTRQRDAHRETVNAVAYSRDGRLLATGGGDATAALWDGAEPEKGLVARLPAYRGADGELAPVGSVAFSRDGRTLAVGTADGTVRLWDITTPARPAPRATLPRASADPDTSAVGLAFSPASEVLAVGGYGTTVHLFDVRDLDSPRRLTVLGGPTEPLAHTAAVRDLAFSPDGTRVATGGLDGRAVLWTVPRQPGTARAIAELANPDDPVPLDGYLSAVAFSRDGASVYRSSAGWLEYFGLPGGGAAPVYRGRSYLVGGTTIAAIAALEDGAVAAVSDRRSISVLHPAWSQEEYANLPLDDESKVIAVSPDGRHIATGSDDPDLRVHTWPGTLTNDGILGMQAVDTSAPDGVVFVGSNYDVMAYRSDPTGRGGATLLGWIDDAHPFHATADELRRGMGSFGTIGLELRERDHVLVTASREGFSLWDVAPAALAGWSREPSNGLQVYSDGHAQQPRRPTPLASVTTGDDGRESSARIFTSLDLSPDGTRLALGDNRGAIHLWDVTDPRRPRSLGTRAKAHPETNRVIVAFSSDGALVASSGNDQMVRLWDPDGLDDPGAGPLAEGSFGGHPGDLAFSPTDPVLAVGGADRRVHLVDVSDPTVLRPLGATSPAANWITAVVFSPDGRRLAAGGGDVRLWDVDPGHREHPDLIADLTGQAGLPEAATVTDLAFDATGRQVLMAGTDMVSTPWLATDADQVAAGHCGRRGSPVSPEEWDEFLPDVPYRDPCT